MNFHHEKFATAYGLHVRADFALPASLATLDSVAFCFVSVSFRFVSFVSLMLLLIFFFIRLQVESYFREIAQC